MNGSGSEERQEKSSRSRSPSLAINGIPPDVLKNAMIRMRDDGWYSKNALIIQLLRDYGDGKIEPTAAPPPFDPERQRRRGGVR